jgi:hypothetical protein
MSPQHIVTPSRPPSARRTIGTDCVDMERLSVSDEKRKTLPSTKWGKPMQIPEGTRFGTGTVSGTRHLMSGREAQQAENIVALFEAIKGRKAMAEEMANVHRRLKAP